MKTRETYISLVGGVLTAIAGASSFEEALQATLSQLCQILNWNLGHVFYVTNDKINPTLYSSNIWCSYDENHYTEFKRVTKNFRPTIEGMPLSPQWRDDIREASFARQKMTAVPLGLAGAFNIPIVYQGRVVAVVELFNDKILPRNEAILEFASLIGIHLAIAYGRDQSKKQEPPNTPDHPDSSLIYNEKMAALTTLVGGLAHEVNNPLTIVLGSLRLLQKELEHESINKETLKTHLSKIDRASLRLVKIVKELGTFSQFRLSGNLEEKPIGDILVQSLSQLGSRIQTSQTELRIKNGLNHPCLLRTKGEQLNQVFINLISNSLDAIEMLPEKWIEVTIQDDESDGLISVKIQDSGPGIPPDIQGKMMLPFFSTKKSELGMGMGLSSAKGIIEGHGGSLIYLQEEPRTTFLIQLPRNQVTLSPAV